jgi:hypothetical protein
LAGALPLDGFYCEDPTAENPVGLGWFIRRGMVILRSDAPQLESSSESKATSKPGSGFIVIHC